MTSGRMINLRMRNERVPPPALAQDSASVRDASADRLSVMMRQEQTIYRCRDYVLRREAGRQASASASASASTSKSQKMPMIDAACREKMCEWSYRVADHFHANREVIATSFSYLDRFVDRCNCDRTTFKLASMASLYLATKVVNSREISMGSLAELSRGEFEVSHLSAMEGILLQTLEWRLHPPTAQCFIHVFYSLLSPVDILARNIIYQRSRFFAEIAVFDSSLIEECPSAIAFAAILNAMEGLDDEDLSNDLQGKFLASMDELGITIHHPEPIRNIRDRLWFIYSRSEQCQKLDILPLAPPETHKEHAASGAGAVHGDKSPVCVSLVN